jgi:hypothetical protein
MLARNEGLASQLAEAALAIAPGFFAIETGVVDRQLIEALDVALWDPERRPVRARCGQLATALPSESRASGGSWRGMFDGGNVARREAHAYALAAW